MIYLGTIDNAGSDVKNNANTSTPFTIPAGARKLRLVPGAATHMAAMSPKNDAFTPAAAAMFPLGAANALVDVDVSEGALTLAIRKTDAGAGTTKVFVAS